MYIKIRREIKKVISIGMSNVDFFGKFINTVFVWDISNHNGCSPIEVYLLCFNRKAKTICLLSRDHLKLIIRVTEILILQISGTSKTLITLI